MTGLQYGPVGKEAIHICVDMQRMFDAQTPWATDWLRRILPQVVRLCEAGPERTLFTRFIPAQNVDQASGTWRRYYSRYAEMTLSEMNPSMVDLVPELALFVPPATVIDKRVYSPWATPHLRLLLASRKIGAVVISGGETDICVLATVLGAIDLGLRVIIATDALCSSVNETHDAIIAFYNQRLSLQIEAATVDQILDGWRVDG